MKYCSVAFQRMVNNTKWFYSQPKNLEPCTLWNKLKQITTRKKAKFNSFPLPALCDSRTEIVADRNSRTRVRTTLHHKTNKQHNMKVWSMVTPNGLIHIMTKRLNQRISQIKHRHWYPYESQFRWLQVATERWVIDFLVEVKPCDQFKAFLWRVMRILVV